MFAQLVELAKVKGIKMDDGDYVVGMEILSVEEEGSKEKTTLLAVTEKVMENVLI